MPLKTLMAITQKQQTPLKKGMQSFDLSLEILMHILRVDYKKEEESNSQNKIILTNIKVIYHRENTLII